MEKFPLRSQNYITGKIVFSSKDRHDYLEDYSKQDPEYSKDFYINDAKSMIKIRKFQTKAVLDFIDQDTSISGNYRVLDVGCGSGAFLQHFVKHYKLSKENVVGIDPAVDRTKAEYENIIEIELGNYETSTKVDLISFLDALEHFKDADKAIQKASLLLLQSGVLVIKLPNKNSLLYRLAKTLTYIIPAFANIILTRLYQIDYPPPHYIYHNLPSLRLMLQSHGFKVVRSGYINELPIVLLWTRLWGLKPVFKLIVFTLLIPFSIISELFKSSRDSIIVIAKRI